MKSVNDIAISTVLLLLLLISSCQKFDDIEAQEKPVSEFNVAVLEKYSPEKGQRIPYLQVQLNVEIDCDKVNFDSNFKVRNDSILYTLNSITKHEYCKDTVIVPEENIPLESLQERPYNLSITLSNAYTIEGTLTNSDKFIFLDIPEQATISEKKQILRKVPDGYIWGRLSISHNNSIDIVNEFIDHIYERYGEHNLEDGAYTPFIIKDGKVNLNILQYPPKSQFHKSFLISLSKQQDFQQLHDLIEHFKSDSDMNIEVEAYSWNGLTL